jgi:hypothetical protein
MGAGELMGDRSFFGGGGGDAGPISLLSYQGDMAVDGQDFVVFPIPAGTLIIRAFLLSNQGDGTFLNSTQDGAFGQLQLMVADGGANDGESLDFVTVDLWNSGPNVPGFPEVLMWSESLAMESSSPKPFYNAMCSSYAVVDCSLVVAWNNVTFGQYQVHALIATPTF